MQYSYQHMWSQMRLEKRIKRILEVPEHYRDLSRFERYTWEQHLHCIHAEIQTYPLGVIIQFGRDYTDWGYSSTLDKYAEGAWVMRRGKSRNYHTLVNDWRRERGLKPLPNAYIGIPF